MDGQTVAERQITTPGPFSIRTVVHPQARSAVVTIKIDKTFSAPGDVRDLGLVLIGIGFEEGR
jgi:hypothetical protein